MIPTVLALAGMSPAWACDVHTVFHASETQGAGKGFFAGASEQFTHFGTLSQDGHKVENEADQWLESSISQVFMGYNFTRQFGVQFNLPFIHREFKRPDGLDTDRSHVSGLGDASLTANLVLFEREDERFTLRWSALGGLKFPTGDSSRLAEELSEVEAPGALESGIHGHDLTLGSGSLDGIIGSSVFVRWKHLLATTHLQYNACTKGDYGYSYANNLQWGFAPGAYLVLHERQSLVLQLVVSGETKGKDTFQGAYAEDTAITSVYLGPQATYTWSDQLSIQLGMDLPIHQENSALQIVPDYRIQAALLWRF